MLTATANQFVKDAVLTDAMDNLLYLVEKELRAKIQDALEPTIKQMVQELLPVLTADAHRYFDHVRFKERLEVQFGIKKAD